MKHFNLILALLFGLSATSLSAQSASTDMNHAAFSNLAVFNTAFNQLANYNKTFNRIASKDYTVTSMDNEAEKLLFTVFRKGLPKQDFTEIVKPKCWTNCDMAKTPISKNIYVLGYTPEITTNLTFNESKPVNKTVLAFRF